MYFTMLLTEDPVPLSPTPGTHRGLLKRKLSALGSRGWDFSKEPKEARHPTSVFQRYL